MSKTPSPTCAKIVDWLLEDDEEAISEDLKSNMETLLSTRTKDDISLAVVVWEP